MTARDDVVRIALSEKGQPYRAHRDCSGFTAWAFRQAGITIPEGSVAQYSVGQPTHDYSREPGLLHFWDTFGEPPGHVALGVGGGQVVHALNEQRGIVVSDVRANMGGRGRYMGARRILDGGSTPPTETGGALPEPPAVMEPHAPATAPPARPPRRGPARERTRDRRRFWQRVSDQLRRRRK